MAHNQDQGKIPEGESGDLKLWVEKITLETPSRANSDNFEEIPFMTIGDIRGNTFVYSISESLTDLDKAHNRISIPEGSLCTSQTVGEITYYWMVLIHQQINSIVLRMKRIDIIFILCWKLLWKC